MSQHTFLTTVLAPLALTLAFAGCGTDSTPPAEQAKPEAPPAGADAHEHAHPAHGPHDGDLIELGDEQYHAELVHPEGADDEQIVTIYVLDGTAKQAVAIDADEVTINLKHEGMGEQFKLAAAPDEGDEDGKSSRFTSEDPELIEHLGEADVDAQLVIEIDGKPYRGRIEHGHDHGHEH